MSRQLINAVKGRQRRGCRGLRGVSSSRFDLGKPTLELVVAHACRPSPAAQAGDERAGIGVDEELVDDGVGGVVAEYGVAGVGRCCEEPLRPIEQLLHAGVATVRHAGNVAALRRAAAAGVERGVCLLARLLLRGDVGGVADADRL